MWGLGVGKTVRVIPGTDAGLILLNFLRSITTQCLTDYVTSIQEAETILDSYKEEVERRKGPSANEKFKIIDMDGWEYEKRYLTYDDAIKSLKYIRESGRQTAIVVDAAVSLCNRLIRYP